MDAERWKRVGTVFSQLIEMDDPVLRRQRLAALQAEDAELAAEVEALLASHAQDSSFLDQPAQPEASAMLARQIQNRLIGRRFGVWVIEHLLSEGGMGRVFRARRDDPDFSQTVALKLIRTGLESSQLVERFEQERRLLAQLSHAHIARLIDGGTSEDGLPWLAMEYVQGLPIDQWCDERTLDINQRLALFDQVCRAVHFAHQNLIIHRDIKPGNVLVDEHGQVKLLDFGIAKLVESSVDADRTRTQQRMITPSAASPEQFRGETVTTASDVYSLGLLLYRLLTGRPAYDIDATTPVRDTERLICREMPARPSQAVRESAAAESIAQARQTRPDRLPRQLRGDLDTIVLKALRKEPERRYGSVEELAEDLRRHRQGLPVSARPDSVRYRAGKFVRRHWMGLGATAGAFLALGIGLSIAIWQTEQARAERDRTLRINDFLQAILIEADPYQAGAEATVRDVLRKASEMVGERFGDQPDLEAPLRYTIGYTQLSLMDLDESQANLERADELNRPVFGVDDERTLTTQAYLAWIEFRRGRFSDAEAGYRAVIERLSDRHDFATRANIHNELGLILGEQERWDEALVEHQRALDLWLDHASGAREVGVVYNNIAGVLHGQGQLEKAREWYLRALERQRAEAVDGISVDLAYNLNNYAVLLRDLGELEAAIPYYRESLAMRQATLGPDHAFTGFGHLNLGRALLDMDQASLALAELERAIEISSTSLEPSQLQVLVARASLARARALAGDAAWAVDELSSVLPLMRQEGLPERLIDQAEEWLAELSVAPAD